jgi:hypothetical protein
LQNEPIKVSPQAKARIDGVVAAIEAGISPLQVADQVFDAIRQERFYILTEPKWTPLIQLRTDNLLGGQNPQNSGELFMKLMMMKG